MKRANSRKYSHRALAGGVIFATRGFLYGRLVALEIRIIITDSIHDPHIHH